jgi:two-component sensor histidine kinase
LADAKGLGLSIVRTLVTTELAGTIEMRPARVDELTEVEFEPREGNTGTVILLRVPLQSD